MIRSFALTFAAPMLRFWVIILFGIAGLPYLNAYRIISFLCWVPNWILMEFYIYKRYTSKEKDDNNNINAQKPESINL